MSFAFEKASHISRGCKLVPEGNPKTWNPEPSTGNQNLESDYYE